MEIVDEIDMAFLLAARYKKPAIFLEDVILDFMPHLTIDAANRRANKQTLPFPVFRSDSGKSPWLVNISDLAAYLESRRDAAKRDWTAMNK